MSARPFPPTGSVLWLLRHDLRLAWRDLRGSFGALGPWSLAVLALLAAGIMHGVAWTIAPDIGAESADAATRDLAAEAALPAALFILLLMTAQTLNGATKLLYARGDLDLVLSSPVSPRRVLGVRALAVALGAFASAAIFVLPLADAGALTGHPSLLALYPALVGAALLAAAAGLAVTLALFRVIGPRRTRLAAQVLATFLGAGFVIAVQVRRLLPEMAPPAVFERGGVLHGALLVPVRAALGDPAALALWLALAAAAFGAATILLGPAFARSANAAAGAGAAGGAGAARRTRRARRRDAGAFARSPLAGLRRKERRLILRDPWVVSQVLLQILYMTPMIALLWSGSGDPTLAVAPMIVVVTFQVASSLTWLGLSGEDAPDLLASAPVSAAALRRGKIEAVGSLTLAIVALPLAYLAWVSPSGALITAALAALGLGAAVALQSWHGRPGRRSAFAARHRESKLVGLAEMSLSILFGLATALAVQASAWALAPLALAGAAMAALKPRRRPRGSAGTVR